MYVISGLLQSIFVLDSMTFDAWAVRKTLRIACTRHVTNAEVRATSRRLHLSQMFTNLLKQCALSG